MHPVAENIVMLYKIIYLYHNELIYSYHTVWHIRIARRTKLACHGQLTALIEYLTGSVSFHWYRAQTGLNWWALYTTGPCTLGHAMINNEEIHKSIMHLQQRSHNVYTCAHVHHMNNY